MNFYLSNLKFSTNLCLSEATKSGDSDRTFDTLYLNTLLF